MYAAMLLHSTIAPSTSPVSPPTRRPTKRRTPSPTTTPANNAPHAIPAVVAIAVAAGSSRDCHGASGSRASVYAAAARPPTTAPTKGAHAIARPTAALSVAAGRHGIRVRTDSASRQPSPIAVADPCLAE